MGGDVYGREEKRENAQNGTQREGMDIKKECRRVRKERGEVYAKELNENITWTQSLNEKLEMQLKYNCGILYYTEGGQMRLNITVYLLILNLLEMQFMISVS